MKELTPSVAQAKRGDRFTISGIEEDDFHARAEALKIEAEQRRRFCKCGLLPCAHKNGHNHCKGGETWRDAPYFYN